MDIFEFMNCDGDRLSIQKDKTYKVHFYLDSSKLSIRDFIGTLKEVAINMLRILPSTEHITFETPNDKVFIEPRWIVKLEPMESIPE